MLASLRESLLDNLELKKIECVCFAHPSCPSQQLLHLLGLQVEEKWGKGIFIKMTIGENKISYSWCESIIT